MPKLPTEGVSTLVPTFEQALKEALEDGEYRALPFAETDTSVKIGYAKNIQHPEDPDRFIDFSNVSCRSVPQVDEFFADELLEDFGISFERFSEDDVKLAKSLARYAASFNNDNPAPLYITYEEFQQRRLDFIREVALYYSRNYLDNVGLTEKSLMLRKTLLLYVKQALPEPLVIDSSGHNKNVIYPVSQYPVNTDPSDLSSVLEFVERSSEKITSWDGTFVDYVAVESIGEGNFTEEIPKALWFDKGVDTTSPKVDTQVAERLLNQLPDGFKKYLPRFFDIVELGNSLPLNTLASANPVVTEYLPKTLDKSDIEVGVSSVESSLGELTEILDFVIECRKLGYVYTDVKTDNIRRRKDGTIVVFDLGSVQKLNGLERPEIHVFNLAMPPEVAAYHTSLTTEVGGDIEAAYTAIDIDKVQTYTFGYLALETIFGANLVREVIVTEFGGNGLESIYSNYDRLFALLMDKVSSGDSGIRFSDKALTSLQHKKAALLSCFSDDKDKRPSLDQLRLSLAD